MKNLLFPLVLLSMLVLVVSGCFGSFEERMQAMKELNASGCSYMHGGGNPPASRIDGGIVGAWGDGVSIKDCPEIFKGLK